MKDIKIITVVVGNGGKLAARFDDNIGELRIWPSDQIDIIPNPDTCTIYELPSGGTIWTMADNRDLLEKVKP